MAYFNLSHYELVVVHLLIKIALQQFYRDSSMDNDSIHDKMCIFQLEVVWKLVCTLSHAIMRLYPLFSGIG